MVVTALNGTFAHTTAFTGLETLGITTTASTASTVSIDVAAKFDTNLTSISITDPDTTKDDTTVTLTNVNTGTTVTLNNSLATSADIGMAATTGTLTLALAGGVTVPSLLGSVAANRATTLNIVSNGTGTTAQNNTITSLTTGVNNTTGVVNISGSQALSLTTGAVDVLTIDGSTATGKLTIVNTSNTKASATVKGGTIGDAITGATVANALYGNEGNDTITGGAGADTIYGGTGDDTINGSAGTADTVYGGTGKDTITVNQSGDKIIYAVGDTGTVAASTADVLSGVVQGTIVDLSAYITAGGAANFVPTGAGTLAVGTAGASTTLRDIYIDNVKNAIVIEMDATGTTTQEIVIGKVAGASSVSMTAAGVLTFDSVPMISYMSGNKVVVEGQSTDNTTTVTADLSTSIPQVYITGATAAYVNGAVNSSSSLDMSKLTGATGTIIKGSSLNDTIIGSATLANRISSGGGTDALTGGSGNYAYIFTTAPGASNIVDATSGGTTDTLYANGAALDFTGLKINGTAGGDMQGASDLGIEQIMVKADSTTSFLALQLSGNTMKINGDAAGTSYIAITGTTSADAVDLTNITYTALAANTAGVATPVAFDSSDYIKISGGAGVDTITLANTTPMCHIIFGNTSTVTGGTDIAFGSLSGADGITGFLAGAGGDMLVFDISAFGLAGSTEYVGAIATLAAASTDEIAIITGGAGYATDELAEDAVATQVTTDGLDIIVIYFNTTDSKAHIIHDPDAGVNGTGTVTLIGTFNVNGDVVGGMTDLTAAANLDSFA